MQPLPLAYIAMHTTHELVNEQIGQSDLWYLVSLKQLHDESESGDFEEIKWQE